jgi:hypothetical protein
MQDHEHVAGVNAVARTPTAASASFASAAATLATDRETCGPARKGGLMLPRGTT